MTRDLHRSTVTPRQLAEAIGVSESSVKRWVDDGRIAASRTSGGHRRISLAEAARYVRESGSAVVRPDLLGLPEAVSASESVGTGDRDEAGGALFRLLRAGAAAEAQGLILSRYLRGESVAQIVDGVLVQALERVGELWLDSPSGIYWEHRAMEIAFGAISRLRLLLPSPNGAPRAVGGAPSGDPYRLATLAVATVLESEGVRATNLGPETPISTLALAAEDLDARLVWLSVSVAADAERLRREIERLGDRLAERGALLVAGGAQSHRLGLTPSDSIYLGRSMAELEALVRGMRLAPPSAAPA
jgi:excisionase family DNA binding protein